VSLLIGNLLYIKGQWLPKKLPFRYLLLLFNVVIRGGLKACGDEGALRFQLTKAKAVYGMKLCGMQETAFGYAVSQHLFK